MSTFLRLIFCLTCATAPALVPAAAAKADKPESTEPVPAETAADTAWRHVVALATPLPPAAVSAATRSGGPIPRSAEATATLAAAFQAQEEEQKARARQAAQSARDFYTQNPQHPKAAAAKKLEALAGLQSLQLGDTADAPAAKERAQAYRSDPTQPAKDRYDIALALELAALPRTLKGQGLIDDGDAYEQLADALPREFPDLPEAYNLSLSLLRTADHATALKVARKLAKQKKVPDFIQLEAQQTLDRNALLGQTLDLALTSLQRQTLALKTLTGQPTVLYIWSTLSGPSDLALLAPFKATLPAKTTWIYLAFGKTFPPMAEVQAQAPFYGTYCFEPTGFASPIAQRLHVSQAPYVYVFDRQAKLSGYGRVEDLPTLLAAASR